MSKSQHEIENECRRGLYQKQMTKHKRIIKAAAEDGIQWRGEYYEHFLRVIDEVEMANQLRDEDYRFEAVRYLKSLRVVNELPYDKRRNLS